MENTTKTNWKIDTVHSEVAFKSKHMMISTVTGYFDNFDSSVETDGEDFNNAKIEFSAKTDSVNTKTKDRDTHLKSDDFFNSAKFPELKFTSKSFDGEKLVGDLTIRDITKEIILDVDFNGFAVDQYGRTKAGFEIRGEINRKDFNLSWNAVTEAGNIVVSDKIKIIVDAQYIKQP